MNKDKYIYREYHFTSTGYGENTYITSIFDSLNELMQFIEKRKQFYKSYCHIRKVEIEIIGGNNES